MKAVLDLGSVRKVLAEKANVLDKVLDVDALGELLASVQLLFLRKRFLDHESPQQTQWEESYSSKLRQKAGETTGDSTLFDTGALYQSLQMARESLGAFSIGTSMSYAAKHQYGGDVFLGGKTINLPARPFVGFQQNDPDVLLSILQNRISERLKIANS